MYWIMLRLIKLHVTFCYEYTLYSGGIWLHFCNLTDYVGRFMIRFTATLAASQATEVETNCSSNFKYSKSNIAATTQIT